MFRALHGRQVLIINLIYRNLYEKFRNNSLLETLNIKKELSIPIIFKRAVHAIALMLAFISLSVAAQGTIPGEIRLG